MKALKLTIILSCLITALTCSAAKYQIKVLNTPTITIDNRQAKVGDWFTDESVIVWSRDNQAMRVVSDENKVYTLSAKLYKEAKAKKFSDFILYTKPLAARGTNDLDLKEQLAERFDNTFVMLDEIVIDLSGICLPKECGFYFRYNKDDGECHLVTGIPINNKITIKRSEFSSEGVVTNNEVTCSVEMIRHRSEVAETITETFIIVLVPIQSERQ